MIIVLLYDALIWLTELWNMQKGSYMTQSTIENWVGRNNLVGFICREFFFFFSGYYVKGVWNFILYLYEEPNFNELRLLKNWGIKIAGSRLVFYDVDL